FGLSVAKAPAFRRRTIAAARIIGGTMRPVRRAGPPFSCFSPAPSRVGGSEEICISSRVAPPPPYASSLLAPRAEFGELPPPPGVPPRFLPPLPTPFVVLPSGDHVMEKFGPRVVPAAQVVPGRDKPCQVVGPLGILVDRDVELAVQGPQEFVFVILETKAESP